MMKTRIVLSNEILRPRRITLDTKLLAWKNMNIIRDAKTLSAMQKWIQYRFIWYNAWQRGQGIYQYVNELGPQNKQSQQ